MGTKQNTNSNLAITRNNLPVLGSNIEIEPIAEFQAQIALSRQNLSLESAEYAIKIVLQKLKNHDKYTDLLSLAVVNKCEIFGKYYDNKKLSIVFDSDDETNKVHTIQKLTEKYFTQNKDFILKIESEKWEMQIFSFYKTSACFFSEYRKNIYKDKTKVECYRIKMTEFLQFPISNKMRSMVEKSIFDFYVKVFDNDLVLHTKELLFLEALGYPIEMDPEKEIWKMTSALCFNFLCNPIYQDTKIHNNGCNYVQHIGFIYEICNTESVRIIFENSDDYENLNDEEFDKDLKNFIVGKKEKIESSNLKTSIKEITQILKKWRKEARTQN